MKENNEKVISFFSDEYLKMISYVRKYFSDTAERDAEDIVQEVALNVFETIDLSESMKNISAYVYRSLKNRIIDIYRENKRTISLDQPLRNTTLTLKEVISHPADDLNFQWQKKEMRELLFRVLDKLKSKDRAVIIATEFENRSFQELADDWEVPVGTLLARKSRALQKIKRALLKYKNLLWEE